MRTLEKSRLLEIGVRTETPPALPFLWRARDGVRHPITGMETRHLFHTVRMIWNHHMPPEARSTKYKRYHFGSFYTTAYLGEAIRRMIPELMQRDDLQSDWRAEIDRWLVYLGHADRGPPELKNPPLMIE
jgi:hypothetical protein